LIWIHGYGFPAYRGGPMCYGELCGLRKVYDRIRALEREHGKLWAPSPLLARLSQGAGTFASL
jgi:3-hydroxyacyl-CoA dehydrogenase